MARVLMTRPLLRPIHCVHRTLLRFTGIPVRSTGNKRSCLRVECRPRVASRHRRSDRVRRRHIPLVRYLPVRIRWSAWRRRRKVGPMHRRCPLRRLRKVTRIRLSTPGRRRRSGVLRRARDRVIVHRGRGPRLWWLLISRIRRLLRNPRRPGRTLPHGREHIHRELLHWIHRSVYRTLGALRIAHRRRRRSRTHHVRLLLRRRVNTIVHHLHRHRTGRIRHPGIPRIVL